MQFSILGMELVGPSKRKVASVVDGIFFALGQVFLGVMAYFFRNYQYLQLVISLPSVMFLSYWWLFITQQVFRLVPESARWLISLKRFEEADVILQRAAKINGKKLPEAWWEQIESLDDSKSTAKDQMHKRYNILDLFRTRQIRIRTLACLFIWPVVSMIYYGVSMKTDFLGGDFYFTFIIGGLSEIPALLLVYLILDRVGRKIVLSAGYFIAAFCILTNLIIPSSAHWSINIVQFLLAKAAITSSYAVIYTITPELFPTVIRNIAMGCCSMIARIGAISASYISMWIVEYIGKWAMIIPFGSFALAAGFVVLFFIPETMGKPLPETINDIERKQSIDAEAMIMTVNLEREQEH
ncbi:unnamed protein product [Dracunculus medinensis]|uniref:MFS domain-containing protein n=1 Tax=Dracunculus medinensis TaxID=318479 RepID=A0A0N4UQ87_DRAME|nr:unnamed protein product [Dracunculus medinensis]